MAMQSDGLAPKLIRVDGGMVNNTWFAQRLADVLSVPVDRPAYVETTVLGAAYSRGSRRGCSAISAISRSLALRTPIRGAMGQRADWYR